MARWWTLLKKQTQKQTTRKEKNEENISQNGHSHYLQRTKTLTPHNIHINIQHQCPTSIFQHTTTKLKHCLTPTTKLVVYWLFMNEMFWLYSKVRKFDAEWNHYSVGKFPRTDLRKNGTWPKAFSSTSHRTHRTKKNVEISGDVGDE